MGLWYFDNLYLILIFRGLSGVAASTWVTFTVLYSSYFAEKDTPKAIGYINSINKFGQMIAMLLSSALSGTWFASKYGEKLTITIGFMIWYFPVSGNKRATAMGFFQAVYGIGMFAGPVLFGILGDYFGMTLGFVITDLMGILGIMITAQNLENESHSTF